MSIPPRWPVCLVCIVFMAVPTPSRALGDEGEVQREIAEATQLYEGLDYERALDRLHRASRLPHSQSDAITLCLLRGIIQAEMGRWESARKDFRKALQQQLDVQLPLKVSPKVRREFESQRTKVRGKQVGRRAEAPATPAPPLADPRPEAMAPLSRDVEVARPGLTPPLSGEGVLEGLSPVAVGEDGTRSREGLWLAGRRVPWGSWVLLGTGFAAGGAGVVFGASSRRQSDRANSALLREDATAHHTRARESAGTANILFGTASVAVVGALATWFFMGDSDEEPAADGGIR